MGKGSSISPGRRPVFIADYRRPVFLTAPGEDTDRDGIAAPTAPAAAPESVGDPEGEPNLLPIRHQFPAAGETRAGGCGDGYCFRVTFAAGRLERSYEMVVAFLREQGYGDLPLPADAAELRRFRLPPKLRHQLSLFGDNGYVHNPVKVLFPVPAGHRGALIVELYNEAAAEHLLRFHRLQ